MNGATFSRVMSVPLVSPVRAPANIAMTIAAAGPPPAPPLLSTSATTTDVIATIEPTERSMPPRMMTSVMPSAAVPTMAVCLAMVSIVRIDVKLSGPMSAKKR